MEFAQYLCLHSPFLPICSGHLYPGLLKG